MAENQAEKKKHVGRPRKPDSELKHPRRKQKSKEQQLEELALMVGDRVPETPKRKFLDHNSLSKSSKNANPDEIQTILQNNLSWFGRTAAKTDDEIEYRLRELFDACSRRGEIPTMEKLALVLGVHVRTIEYWISGGTGSTPRRKELLGQAKMMIAAADAELAMRYKINAAAYIFRAKNYYGMSDNQTFIIQPQNNPLGDEVDQDELERRIRESVVIDE